MTVPKRKNIVTLVRILKKMGYKIYSRPYELNIVGVRDDSVIPNKFDDAIYVFWKNDSNKWEGKMFMVTTDPGTYYLKNPLSILGAAMLKEGQYVGAYQIGDHKGTKALVQTGGKVTVYRDYDRDAILDFNNGREETGSFGINIHRAGASGTTIDVDKWSAGCQVFENADDFKTFMELAEKYVGLYGNRFTYTLLDERAYNRAKKRWLLYTGLAVAGLFAIWSGYRAYRGLPIIPKI